MKIFNKEKDVFGETDSILRGAVSRDSGIVKKVNIVLSIEEKDALTMKLNKGINSQIIELQSYINGKKKIKGAWVFIRNVQEYIDCAKDEYPKFNSLEFDNQLKELIIPACKYSIGSYLNAFKKDISSNTNYIINIKDNIKYGRGMLSGLFENSDTQEFLKYLDSAEQELDLLIEEIIV